ncbi:MAG: cyclopropane-fatty-acyl-phospholipid synthase family protein [Pseudomonadota bacterium]
MRRAIRNRLEAELEGGPVAQKVRFDQLIASLKRSAIALSTTEANEQHYELPARFFQQTLGPRLKYSSSYWPDRCDSLAEAEEHMLRLTCERAGLIDGDNILELGCGWGSLTLWMAEQFPNSTITAVSNSRSQRAFIEQHAAAKQLDNVHVITSDMNTFSTNRQFDRVVSIEMFEHMRNYQMLLSRIAQWLKPNGTLFVHIFCHDKVMYPFSVNSEQDWMARYFFTNGLMPARHTLEQFQDDLVMEDSWIVSGQHYALTADAWLLRLDAAENEVLPVFERTYGKDQARVWFQRWRMFFMACAEFFAMDNGTQWYVAHYLMRRPNEIL